MGPCELEVDSLVNYGFLLWITCAQRTHYEIRVTVTGIPFKTLFPDNGSISFSSVKIFEFTPAREVATRVLVPGIECPQPCGKLTTPVLTESVISSGASTLPTRLVTRTFESPATPSRDASVGCICRVHRSLPLTKTSMLCIHELFERKCRRPTRVNCWSSTLFASN